MVYRDRIDFLSGSGKTAAHPLLQLLLSLLGKLDHLGALRQGGGELLQLGVGLIGYLPVQKHQRAVLREVLQQRHQRSPLGLVQLEQVHILHRDQGALRHHRHGLRRLDDLLHSQALACKPVIVELLKARRHKPCLQLRHRLLHQVRLLAVEYIDIPHGAALQRVVEFLITGGLFFFLLCHAILRSQ